MVRERRERGRGLREERERRERGRSAREKGSG